MLLLTVAGFVALCAASEVQAGGQDNTGQADREFRPVSVSTVPTSTPVPTVSTVSTVSGVRLLPATGLNTQATAAGGLGLAAAGLTAVGASYRSTRPRRTPSTTP